MDRIEWDDFQRVELRVGTIVEVTDFPEARKPAYKLKVDFGDGLGIKKSSAQVTDLYDKVPGPAVWMRRIFLPTHNSRQIPPGSGPLKSP